MKILNNKIYFNTFLKKGIKDNKDEWGVYFITGYQGSGKNFFATFMLTTLDDKMKIYTNVKTLHIPRKNIAYFEKITDIVGNIEENCIFFLGI